MKSAGSHVNQSQDLDSTSAKDALPAEGAQAQAQARAPTCTKLQRDCLHVLFKIYADRSIDTSNASVHSLSSVGWRRFARDLLQVGAGHHEVTSHYDALTVLYSVAWFKARDCAETGPRDCAEIVAQFIQLPVAFAVNAGCECARSQLYLDGTPSALGRDFHEMIYGTDGGSLCGGGDGKMQECMAL